MSQIENSQRKAIRPQEKSRLQVVNVQRNPYLLEYDTGRKGSRQRNITTQRQGQAAGKNYGKRDVSAIPRSRRAAARRRRERRRRRNRLLAVVVVSLVLCIWLYRTFWEIPQADGSVPPAENEAVEVANSLFGQRIQGLKSADYLQHPIWNEDFLTVNEYSRPGDALKEVNNIFVHYTANPGTSAAQNRSYFEQLKDTHERSASAHFIIGYEGEIVHCVPLDEIAYAVVGRNEDSISIECCYTAEDGSFTQETYDSLIQLLKWLTETYDLKEEDILRHYDCGGKKCPLYYTEHEDAWKQLKRDVGSL